MLPYTIPLELPARLQRMSARRQRVAIARLLLRRLPFVMVGERRLEVKVNRVYRESRQLWVDVAVAVARPVDHIKIDFVVVPRAPC